MDSNEPPTCVTRQPAMLLLGPTGSGKTPLGSLIESRGWHGARCLHFDFGQNLREIARRDTPDDLISPADIEFLRGVLASGELLEDERFSLAERILRSFLARRKADAQTCIILNGLPRHVGQAVALDAMVAVHTVLCLECSPETVLHRLANDVGRDRAGRTDDDLQQVRAKLETFDQRTAPLVGHYRRAGARIVAISVIASMTAEDMLAILATPLTARQK